MITKKRLISSLDNLPENLSIEQLIEHIKCIEHVERGMDDSDNNRIHTKEEAKQVLKQSLR